MSEQPELTKEERILRMMKRTLTSVAKDTHAKPGFRHPLTEETVNLIRNCLSLIASREQELAEEHGRPMNMRPRFIDEPRSEVVVKLDVNSLRGGKDGKPEH
ncbi:segregation and condensation protein A [Thiohalobacter sp.]|uniref:segregation and condensation protein A n=1 Tax=Thiohalobacter sp. TaxID=2025948 RepID=UPI0026327342|nr:segregation and condensation protein A [Thiohalobacter sp.]